MLILPAIDIYEGKCVRLRQGNYSEQTIYATSPREVAQRFYDAGLNFIHVVDLEGAKERRIVNWKTLEELSHCQGLSFEIGGGIRTKSDVDRLVSLGVARIILGSIAVHSPAFVEEMIQTYGSERIAVGVDVKDNIVAIHGWQEQSTLTATELITAMIRIGVRCFICTDITRDGMLQGPNTHLYQKLVEQFPNVSFIASGGISSKDDILKLSEMHIAGVVVGKAYYEGKISLQTLSELQQGLKQC